MVKKHKQAVKLAVLKSP